MAIFVIFSLLAYLSLLLPASKAAKLDCSNELSELYNKELLILQNIPKDLFQTNISTIFKIESLCYESASHFCQTKIPFFVDDMKEAENNIHKQLESISVDDLFSALHLNPDQMCSLYNMLHSTSCFEGFEKIIETRVSNINIKRAIPTCTNAFLYFSDIIKSSIFQKWKELFQHLQHEFTLEGFKRKVGNDLEKLSEMESKYDLECLICTKQKALFSSACSLFDEKEFFELIHSSFDNQLFNQENYFCNQVFENPLTSKYVSDLPNRRLGSNCNSCFHLNKREVIDETSRSTTKIRLSLKNKNDTSYYGGYYDYDDEMIGDHLGIHSFTVWDILAILLFITVCLSMVIAGIYLLSKKFKNRQDAYQRQP